MKQLLDPNKLANSICEAIHQTRQCADSISRIKGMIANLPPGNIHIRHSEKRVKFYEYVNGSTCHLSKTSDKLYLLCRKRYLHLLLQILELVDAHYDYKNLWKTPQANCYAKTASRISYSCIRIDSLTSKLKDLLDAFAEGNLDVARIVMTSKQYWWYTRKYPKKELYSKTIHKTGNGVKVRSKSERDAGNCYEDFAVPFHYEELLVINAVDLVKSLQLELKEEGFTSHSICVPKGRSCLWNVPEELSWMNSSGSIWKAYDPIKGKIYIYNDFQIMLADNELMIHEHEGRLEDFRYRNNASERTYVMLVTNTVKRKNLITTSEADIENINIMRDIIRQNILPRLWF